MDYRIKETLIKIEANLFHPIDIQNIAETLNISVYYLQHLFKSEVGTSIIKYTNSLRLQKAKELLETTHLRVKEIRLKVGIKDETQFARSFKIKFGSSPNEYRKNFKIAETIGKYQK